MKTDRITEIMRLTSNLELMLKESGEKFVVFTTDVEKYDIVPTVNEIAVDLSASNKIMVLSYEEIEHADGIEYLVLDAKTDSKEDIETRAEMYDIVIVVCPSMMVSKSYLHAVKFAHDIVFMAKKWKSKTANIKAMAEIASNEKMTILGTIYEK